MAVYIDPLFDCRAFIKPGSAWRWSHSCHMFADTIEELHAFARKLGLRRSWFQADPRLPHYDLNAKRRAAAVRLGAQEVSFDVTARYMKARVPKRKRPDDTVPNVLELAAKLFVHARNRQFWDYFERDRKLTRETLDHFMIGFAPARPLLALQEFDAHNLMAAGLLDERHYRKTGVLQARHERMFSFPYLEDNEVLGMVFRSTVASKNEAAAHGGRYFNLDSCPSLPCPPGRVVRPFLYGPDGALLADPLTLVEGPVDMLRCWQAGITNVAALCGLGISDDRILELLQEPRTIRLFFDWDYEGRRRSFQLAMRYHRYLLEQEALQTDDLPVYRGRLEIVSVPDDWTKTWEKWDDPGAAPNDHELRSLHDDYYVDFRTHIDRVLTRALPSDLPWLDRIGERFVAQGGYLAMGLADPVRPGKKRVK